MRESSLKGGEDALIRVSRKRTVMGNEKRRSEKQKQRRKSTVNYRVKGERREAWMVTGEEGEKEDII